jgi:hydroxymethylbilane synthase
MSKVLRIGTRESQLAVWQAELVRSQLTQNNIQSELVFIKSEGDIDLVTPLYEIGVQGIFTKTLDAALLSKRIDLAVHSMKDVPVQLAKGIVQAAVLKRANYKDIFVPHPDLYNRKANRTIVHVSTSVTYSLGKSGFEKQAETGTKVGLHLPLREHPDKPRELEDIIVATSSVRRIAQWLNKFPNSKIENLRGNVNTRLRKLNESNWHGAIFAAAGLERINLRPENSIELDWVLPAPAQGAIMIVCRENDDYPFQSCQPLNDETTAICTKIERDYLKELRGGCSTPIGAIAEIEDDRILFQVNIVSTDGTEKAETSFSVPKTSAEQLGKTAAEHIRNNGGQSILEKIRDATV